MLHLMQDLLHWAHKLARNGLVELGCVYNFEYMKKLLEYLRSSRQDKGISQDYLAVKLGVSSSTISRWESKGKSPCIDKLFKYASLLDFTVQEVLALSANESAEVPKPVGKIEISAYDKARFIVPTARRCAFSMVGECPAPIVLGWSNSPAKAICSSLQEERRTFSHFPLGISMRFALIAKPR